MTSPDEIFNRRQFLETSLAGSALAGGAIAASLGSLSHSATAAEAPPAIEAYTGAMSCAPGQEVTLHVSTSAPRYAVRVERIGRARKLVWSSEGLTGTSHPIPSKAPENGCDWPVAVKIPVAPDWSSGVYRVELRGENGSANARGETFFILRAAEPGVQARILFQLSTNTYQAYNQWGGSCLYSGPDHPRVSFDRPWQISPPVTTPVTGFYNPNSACYQTWDVPFIEWAERRGYAIEYCANLDLELEPELLKNYRLVLSVGHDEYWSAGMRDSLEAYIGRGGNAAFLSGNAVCWQTRVEQSGRALVCYKKAHERDPAFQQTDRRQLTTLWSDPLLRRPENQMTGVGFAYGGYNGFFGEFVSGPGAGEYTVHRPQHWLFKGTELARGDTFGRLPMPGPQPGIAGYECDGCEYSLVDGLPVPTGRDGTPSDFEILATAPARWSTVDGSANWAKELRAQLPDAPNAPSADETNRRDGSAVFGLSKRGGTVVTVGSCGWPYGLTAGDRVVDRIVRNLLDRLSA